MNSNKRKLVYATAALLIIIIAVIGLSLSGDKKPKAGKEPSKEVLTTVQAYVQAQENSIGADQTSPNSWLDRVKPITTSAWYKSLAPPPNPSTGDASYNYTFAHQKNYTVKAILTNCVWDSTLSPPTDQAGLVDCQLQDQTINRSTGGIIAASDLPFAWTATGKQLDPRISVVQQVGKWLVDGDLTGQAQ